MVRVQDILNMTILEKHKLLAGSGGLNNIVTGINIYEYILNKAHDRTGELYLTSFYNIREGREIALLNHIKVLVDTNCPGLLMGTGTYPYISDAIKNFADENNFPIISFDENIIYSDILQSAYKLILSNGNITYETIILDRILSFSDQNNILKYVIQLNRHFDDYYQVVFFECNLAKDLVYTSIFNQINQTKNNMAIAHDNGLVLVFSSKDKPINITETIDKIIISIFPKYDIGFHFGISCSYNDYKLFKTALIEAKQAYIYCKKITKKTMASIEQIGIYKMLIPISKEGDILKYAQKIINDVKRYDEQHHIDILKTVETYLKCNSDIVKTAKSLFVHKNTIRYRLKKVKEIIDNTNSDCMEQLTMAIRLLKLNDKN